MARRRVAWSAVAGCLLIAWATVLWLFLRPPEIVGDWQGWRQADTQTIAQRFAEVGSSLLYPRIAWGGAGPGYVETELQLYPWLVSKFFFGSRYPEWPGQALSLVFAIAAAWSVFVNLARRFDGPVALLGMLAFVATRGVVHCATSVQPEALCLLCYVVAWFAFERYLRGARNSDLIQYAVFGATAMLVKPTAAHLGISSFAFVALAHSRSLFDKKLWAAWVLMVALLGAHLWHARNLYLLTGNTFGVLSGGDSKLPHLAQLFRLHLLLRSALSAVTWGTGWAGSLALVSLVISRRFSRELTALLVGNAVWLLLTLRYSSQTMGSHYSILAALLGALALAELSRDVAFRARRWLPLLGFAPLLTLADSWRNRSHDRAPLSSDAPTLAAGRLLSKFAKPAELVVVRSVEPATDLFWQTPNNFEDPRVFYISSTRGFALASDDSSTDELERAVAASARYYVEPEPRESPDGPVNRWLARNAELVGTSAFGGRLFRLTRH